jgi:predicted amidophosphoribosyltransferase
VLRPAPPRTSRPKRARAKRGAQALNGNFGEAETWAQRALELRPSDAGYQQRRGLIGEARRAALRDWGTALFPDTRSGQSNWWEIDVLARIRGWDGSTETVPAPLILGEIKRAALEDVYALGIYRPWHAGGPTPLFTRYIKELKPHGTTIALAAILLPQGLILETDWIEEIDVVVPMATSLASFEKRGFELTEQLGQQLGARLCIPVVDAFQRSADASTTHTAGGYQQRLNQLADSVLLHADRSALLRTAEAVLVVDDVVTYGATFEACAKLLKKSYPQLRVYGAALAYTETDQRRDRAEAELHGG